MDGRGVPDIRAAAQQAAAQQATSEAQMKLAVVQVAQNVRSEKANKCINFLIMPFQAKDGSFTRAEADDLTSPSSELRQACIEARIQAYAWLEEYWRVDSLQEQGVAMKIADLLTMAIPEAFRP